MEGYSDVEEIFTNYLYNFCGCPELCFFIISIFVPCLLISVCCYTPYKRKIRIDKRNKLLTGYNTSVIPCYELNPKSYDLNNIERIRIYVYSTPDPKVAFNKLYYINCEIYISKEIKDLLFGGVRYDKETLDRFEQFFKRYCETEVEPIEAAKDISEYNKKVELNNYNMNNNNNYNYP